MSANSLICIAFLIVGLTLTGAACDDDPTCSCSQDDVICDTSCDCASDAGDVAEDTALDPDDIGLDDLHEEPDAELDLALDIALDAADDPDITDANEADTYADAPDDPDTDAIDVPEDLEDEEIPFDPYGVEPDNAAEEWGDCLDGCSHAIELSNVIDLTDFPFEGLRGQLDSRRHDYTYNSVDFVGPDTDVLVVSAPGRTMVEVEVEAYPSGGLIDAVVMTHDGFQTMTFNSAISSTDDSARTVVAAPSVGALPFYVVITDSTNYENYPTGPWVGGRNYGYVVRFNTWDFAPTELGELSAENRSIELSDVTIEEAGDIHYYQLIAPTSDVAASKPVVTFTRTGSDAFVGFVIGTKSIGGDLFWEGWQWDSGDTGSVVLPGSAFRVCNPTPCEGTTEYIFAVTDWNGSAFPFEFSYDLAVTLP